MNKKLKMYSIYIILYNINYIMAVLWSHPTWNLFHIFTANLIEDTKVKKDTKDKKDKKDKKNKNKSN
jgi:hypothetical protein